MPIPTKWKLVAGSVTAVVGISTAAAALSGSEPAELDLKETGSVTAVVDTPTVEFSIVASDSAAADADDSPSPFDSPHDSVDTDGDGITDVAEAALNRTNLFKGDLDPNNSDTDGDKFTDYEEVAIYGTDPTDSTKFPVLDQVDDSPDSPDTPDSSSDGSSDSSASSDSSDGSSDSSASSNSPDHVDAQEIAYVDTDGDGLSDIAEAILGTNPGEKDSDFDDLSDGEEVLRYGTDPNDDDTDNDGALDGEEVDASTDPLNPLDYPGLDETPDGNDSSD